MALIKPFKGISYNSANLGDLGSLITPPYDVIDHDGQELLHRSSPYNIIRLEYGKVYPGDNKEENRYSRAAVTLKKWLDEGVMQVEKRPCFYLYEQSFNYENQNYNRRGIIAALKLEDYTAKVVVPHELTMTGPKKDRLELLKRVRANISPIFTLFPDPEKRVDQYFALKGNNEPDFFASEESGQKHRIWLIDDGPSQDSIATYLSPQPLLIADGHHRYETALHYSRQTKGEITAGSRFILAVLISMNDPGLLVLPTHRLLHNLSSVREALLEKILLANFNRIDMGIPSQISESSFFAELDKYSKKGAFGLISSKQAYLLLPKQKRSETSLAVSLLHDNIIKPLFKNEGDSHSDSDFVSFTHQFSAARDKVAAGTVDYAFILNPIAVEEILDQAREGMIMPQKSTFFYPKLPSGLVLHHFDLSH